MTGKWVGQLSPYDNGLEIVVAINQGAGGSLTGYVTGRSNDTITSGKIEGDKITLETDDGVKLDLVLAGERIAGEVTMLRDGETRKGKIDVGRAK